MRLALATALALLTLTACNNSCQKICKRMAQFAEEECGMFVSPGAVDCCMSAQAGSASSEDRATCRQFGDLDTITDTWSCNDLEDYEPFAGECPGS